MEKTEQEISDLYNRASEQITKYQGTRWSGMSYEQGVKDALNWVIGEDDEIMESFDGT